MKFSKSAIKQSYLIQEPAWHIYTFTKFIEKPTADKKSKNIILIAEGQTGEMLGVPVSTLINEKADWVWVPLFAAVNGGAVDTETEYNHKDLIGLSVEGYTKRGERQDGTPQNQIVEWAPVGTNVKEQE